MLGDGLINQVSQMVEQQIKRTTLGVVSGGRLNLNPPAGFLGHLGQDHVEYDATEAESTSGSSSLLDNLNHIRQRLADLEGGSSHDPVTLSADLNSTLLGLTDQELDLDTQTANRILAGPTTGAAAKPTFRALVAGDIPALDQYGALADNETVSGAWVMAQRLALHQGLTSSGSLSFTSTGSPGVRFEPGTSKVQFSHDGSTWEDMGSGSGDSLWEQETGYVHPVTAGDGVLLDAEAYLNFGTVYGAAGRGLWDDGGVVRVRSDAGIWNQVAGFIEQTDYYISASLGNDTTGDGTTGSPLATMARALQILATGFCTAPVFYLDKGTYSERVTVPNIGRIGNLLIRPWDPAGGSTYAANLRATTGLPDATHIGSSTLNMTTDWMVGGKVFITYGPGARECRTITANTATQVTVDSAWTETPNTNSYFTIVPPCIIYDNTASANMFSMTGAAVNIYGIQFVSDTYRCFSMNYYSQGVFRYCYFEAANTCFYNYMGVMLDIRFSTLKVTGTASGNYGMRYTDMGKASMIGVILLGSGGTAAGFSGGGLLYVSAYSLSAAYPPCYFVNWGTGLSINNLATWAAPESMVYDTCATNYVVTSDGFTSFTTDDLYVLDDADIAGDLNVDGNTILGGTLAVTGLTTPGILKGNLRIANELSGWSNHPYLQKGVFLYALGDNAATTVLSVTTPTGANGGGGWVLFLKIAVFDRCVTVNSNQAVAAAEWIVQRVVATSATAGTALATQVVATNSTALVSAEADIATPFSVLATESGETVTLIRITANHTGTAAASLMAVISAELVWYGFTAPNYIPVLANAAL